MRRFALVAVALVACDRDVSFGTLPNEGADSGSCEVRGASVDVGDGFDTACPGAAHGFHYALCSCSELVTGTLIQSDGFDSRTNESDTSASGAVGVVGAFYPQAAMIGGSLVVAGSDGIPLNADLTVRGDLFDQGQLQGVQRVTVGGSARVGGDVRLSALDVAGALTLAQSSAFDVQTTSALPARDAITTAPPCRCDAPFDVAALIRDASLDNDDATIGLDPDTSMAVFDDPRELTLPCGRYYVRTLNAQRPLTLHVRGNVALFVDSSIIVDANASLTVVLDESAALDLFARNGLSSSGEVHIGDVHAPTRTRLFFQGTDTLFFGAPTVVSASLYAPRSELVTSARFELFGAALVRRASTEQDLLLHYDRALARDGCSAARCTSDASCGSPLRCDHGTCLP